jgi:hypothetical protein
MRSRLIAPLEGNNEVKYSTVKQFKTQTIRVKYGELKKKTKKMIIKKIIERMMIKIR